jgi:SAM-dependent methyltransferase
MDQSRPSLEASPAAAIPSPPARTLPRPVPPLDLDSEGVDLTTHLQGLATTHKDDFRASSLAGRLIRHNKGQRVLDAGCGTGLLSLALLDRGCEVTSVDHDPAMVTVTNDTLHRGGFPEVEAARLSLEHLDELGSRRFDTIYCCDVVEHVEDDGLAVRQLAALLRLDGRLVITVPAWQFLFGERDRRMGHFRRYSRGRLVELLRSNGLVLDSVRWWNLSGFLLNALAIKVLRLRFSESFRYQRSTLGSRLRARALGLWFHTFENHVPVPVGLTLIVVARLADTAAAQPVARPKEPRQ